MCLTEADPVQNDETVLRRVPKNHQFIIKRSDESFELHKNSFGPTTEDTHGISMYRHLFAESAHVAEGRSQSGYYVVGLTAHLMTALGLNIRPDPLPDEEKYLRGHALIPELNRVDYEDKTDRSKKQEIKAFQQQLADLVNERLNDSLYYETE